MRITIAAIICMILITILPQSLGFQDVGGDYGALWLQEHAQEKIVEENATNLWTWGNAPKGFAIHNGTVYPPGQAPQWFYPNYASGGAPIIINNSALSNQQTQESLGLGLDPWLMAQLSGRPVSIVSEPKGPLF